MFIELLDTVTQIFSLFGCTLVKFLLHLNIMIQTLTYVLLSFHFAFSLSLLQHDLLFFLGNLVNHFVEVGKLLFTFFNFELHPFELAFSYLNFLTSFFIFLFKFSDLLSHLLFFFRVGNVQVPFPCCCILLNLV